MEKQNRVWTMRMSRCDEQDLGQEVGRSFSIFINWGLPEEQMGFTAGCNQLSGTSPLHVTKGRLVYSPYTCTIVWETDGMDLPAAAGL